jgi:hypothetical protein
VSSPGEADGEAAAGGVGDGSVCSVDDVVEVLAGGVGDAAAFVTTACPRSLPILYAINATPTTAASPTAKIASASVAHSHFLLFFLGCVAD